MTFFSGIQPYLITSVFSKLDASDHLLVDEVGSHWVLARVVPWSKDFFTEEEPPWSIPLLGALFLGVLLTLGNSIHNMVTATPQG